MGSYEPGGIFSIPDTARLTSGLALTVCARLKRKFHFLIAIFACLHLVGGNYGIFQAMAWSKMLVDYSRQNGLVEGTIRTFDGDHPCAMCKGIAAAKEQDSDRPKSEKIGVRELLLKDFPVCQMLVAGTPAIREIEVLVNPIQVAWETTQGAQPPLPPPRNRA